MIRATLRVALNVDLIGGAEGDRTPDLMTASSKKANFLNQNN